MRSAGRERQRRKIDREGEKERNTQRGKEGARVSKREEKDKRMTKPAREATNRERHVVCTWLGVALQHFIDRRECIQSETLRCETCQRASLLLHVCGRAPVSGYLACSVVSGNRVGKV